MSSINGLNPYLSAYQALATHIDTDQPRHNPLDHTAGDDAEVFDPDTQSWQPTQAAGNGQSTALGDPYREAIDVEMRHPY
ncbi:MULTISPECIES: hypothetical protein [Pseudomonas]|uniref:Uncharacterized protein n=1 Tax=Pseudomonas azadiae TaxID=2843612 RepID=A0ABS6P433_9PSED|nr:MULTISPECIES: hypothetical protein [Pseudomonas]MBV4455226.1 hypothetical protein [Pseudomonas azadiae]NMF42839.1 hypothetical protein [Pseudomonas sp. SWRI 103]